MKTKSKNLKRKAMALAICTVFLVAMTGAISLGIAKDVGTTNTNQGGAAEIAELATSTELRGRNVLLYANYIDSPNEKDNTKNIMTGAGATVTETTTTSATTLKSQLVGKDVFVVPELYDDSWPTPAQIATLTTTFSGFSPVLDDFLDAGGIVIVCEGDMSCAAGETVVNALGFTTITRQDELISVVPLNIVDPTDPLMQGITTLSTGNGWMSFTTRDTGLKIVADYNKKAVIARTKTRHFKIIGFDYFAYNNDMAQVLINAVNQEVVEAPSITIETDKFEYCPCNTMVITININNPTKNPVTFKWYLGAPTLGYWAKMYSMSIPAGYKKTFTVEMHVEKWSETPFSAVWYVDLQDPETGKELAADCACWSYAYPYCPKCESETTPTSLQEIAIGIEEQIKGGA